MFLDRSILRAAAYLAGLHAARQVRAFLSAHDRTRQVQDAVLGELISLHAETAFGRDHCLSSVRNYEDFTSAVPVGNYETLRPYMERVFRGEPTALLPGGENVLMFSQTSGTTGRPKYIPVTRRFLRHMRRGWNVFGLRALQDHPTGWLRPILQISSPMCEARSPTGLPCGAISGLLAARQKRTVRRMYAFDPQISSVADSEARYYGMLRCGLARDVGIITTANPSSTIKLIETGQAHAERLLRDVADGTFNPPGEFPAELAKRIRFKPSRSRARQMARGLERDGELRPTHFWNVAFLANWTGGTLKLYLRRLRELFGDVPIRDIGLLASEGRFSLPIADNTPAGLAEITGNCLEFIPAEDIDSKAPSTLRADELEVGGEYFLVVTNYAGLWRYNIDDRVRVVDVFGRSPVFEFLSRGLHTANITGEKITEYQVVEAMRIAAGRQHWPAERFVLQGRFARRPYYELRIEASGGLSIEELAESMDKSLCELNVEYRSKRRSGRLGPIRPRLLPDGTLDKLEAERIRARGGRAEQYKHQYLLTDVLEDGAA